MNNSELYNHIQQCTDVEELRQIHSTTITEIERDQERRQEISGEIKRLQDEDRSLKEKYGFDTWNLSVVIRERIGELVLNGSHVDIAGTQGHN